MRDRAVFNLHYVVIKTEALQLQMVFPNAASANQTLAALEHKVIYPIKKVS